MITVSTGWRIDSVSGPADSKCGVRPDGSAACRITAPAPVRHDYRVSVTGYGAGTATMHVDYTSAAGLHLARDFTF